MAINRSLRISLLLLGAGVCETNFAGEPLTCTYELRIEEGFLGDVPWTAEVQVGIGEKLSYVIRELNGATTFVLIDEPADVVYCGNIEDGEIRLIDTHRGVGEWRDRNAFVGGLAFRLSELSTEDRGMAIAEILAYKDRQDSIVDEVDAIFPDLLNFNLESGFHEPEGDETPFTVAELHAAAVAQLPGLQDEPIESTELPLERYSVTEHTDDGFLFDPPGDTIHDIWIDRGFAARFTADDGQVHFRLVSFADEMFHEGSIKNGEVELDTRDDADDGDYLGNLTRFAEGPLPTPEERRLRMFQSVASTNGWAIIMRLYAEDQGNVGADWIPVVTDVVEVEGAFPWEADHPIGSLSEFYDRVKDLEPPPMAIDSL